MVTVHDPGTGRTRRRAAAAASAAAAAVLALAGCGGAEGGGGATGQTLTMWTRAATEVQTQRFIDEYNKLGRNTVELRVIPNDTYLQQIATAAGGGNLPDILGADVVYAQQFIDQGFFADITDRVEGLEYADRLAPAHVDVATSGDAVYGVPHTLDLSVLFYNRVLYEEAGLDPDEPPESLEELAEHAARIQELGGGVSGSYFEGRCPGCILFTLWPSVWAEGGDVLNDDGTAARLDSAEMEEVFGVYRGMVEDGLIPESAKQENGSTWISAFEDGDIGVTPMPSTFLSRFEEGPDLDIGVAPIPGVDGGESTFVGGDIVGLSSTTEKTEAAWDFVSWTLRKDTQLSVLGGHSDVMARVDLSDEEAVAGDERLAVFDSLVPKGRTPKSVAFGPTFNDPQGPWLTLARGAVYGPDLRAALETNDPKVDESLGGGA
ncbi:MULTISPECIES: sugar ABC transporter substrate-binding protein [Streptomonospora]|uniref:ABC transporter substrate-binding protein n=2 Tax=Streptomonospora TaxID=104204 RepID=A0ABV9SEP2_9ACTN